MLKLPYGQVLVWLSRRPENPEADVDFIVKSCIFEQNMPCASEINSNDEFKLQHVEPCYSNFKKIKFLLPKSLWPPNLTG